MSTKFFRHLSPSPLTLHWAQILTMPSTQACDVCICTPPSLFTDIICEWLFEITTNFAPSGRCTQTPLPSPPIPSHVLPAFPSRQSGRSGFVSQSGQRLEECQEGNRENTASSWCSSRNTILTSKCPPYLQIDQRHMSMLRNRRHVNWLPCPIDEPD